MWLVQHALRMYESELKNTILSTCPRCFRITTSTSLYSLHLSHEPPLCSTSSAISVRLRATGRWEEDVGSSCTWLGVVRHPRLRPRLSENEASQQAVSEVVKRRLCLGVEMLRDGRLLNTKGIHREARGVTNAKRGLEGCFFGSMRRPPPHELHLGRGLTLSVSGIVLLHVENCPEMSQSNN